MLTSPLILRFFSEGDESETVGEDHICSTLVSVFYSSSSEMRIERRVSGSREGKLRPKLRPSQSKFTPSEPRL